jgi:hypothetical protein
MPDTVSSTRPTLPRLVLSCDRIANARASMLTPYAVNMAESTEL